jgi:hypothetical protein
LYHFCFFKNLSKKGIFKVVIPAKAGIQDFSGPFWTPAFAGVTEKWVFQSSQNFSIDIFFEDEYFGTKKCKRFFS